MALETAQSPFIKGLAKTRPQYMTGPFPLSLKCFTKEEYYCNKHNLRPKEGFDGGLEGWLRNNEQVSANEGVVWILIIN